MRNYIILNGTNSNTINGLLIQSLAPISKPLMRTETEEIDGRDGDISTPLGFSAYDKEITVGLYGNYDINAIIAFFNSEGTVTFSNEPDKYYNYQIFDQIDFERLIRFKTATVTFHIQPFKYGTTGESQTLSGGDPVSDEGTNLVLNGSGLAPFSQFDLKGNTEQSGTPTPDAPKPVKVVTGENVIKICGKNLVDINNFKSGSYSGTTGGYIEYGSRACTINKIPIKSSSTYVVDNHCTNGYTINNLVDAYKADGTFISRLLNNGANGRTFTTTADTAFINLTLSETRDTMRWADYQAGFANGTIQPQIELGSTATTYEPYQEQSYPISLGSIELCKIGDYQDYLWNDNGAWKKHKVVGKQIVDTSSIILANNYTNVEYARIQEPSDFIGYNTYTDHALICSSAVYQDGGSSPVWDNAANIGHIYTRAENIRFWIGFAKNTGLDAIKTALTGCIIYYQLATPVDEEITNEALIEQLDDIDQHAHAYAGRTHIASLAADGNVPHIIAATVNGDASGTITNAGNYFSKPKLTVYGSGDIGIYLNGVQMLQIALGTSGYITIDTNLMEAYQGNLETLMNRQVTGDYSNFKLPVGESTISFSGTVTSCVVENYSRWL